MVIATIRHVVVTIGMIILIPLTIMSGLKILLPEPSYPGNRPDIIAWNQTLAELQAQVSAAEQQKLPETAALKSELEHEQQKYDAQWHQLYGHYADEERPRYQLFLMLWYAVLGLLIIALSFLMLPGFLGAGFLGGGIACFTVGIVLDYYKYLALRCSLVLLALSLVIGLSYWYAHSAMMMRTGESIRKLVMSLCIATIVVLAFDVVFRFFASYEMAQQLFKLLHLRFVACVGCIILGFFISHVYIGAGLILGALFSIAYEMLMQSVWYAGADTSDFIKLLIVLLLFIGLSVFRLVRSRKRTR